MKKTILAASLAFLVFPAYASPASARFAPHRRASGRLRAGLASTEQKTSAMPAAPSPSLLSSYGLDADGITEETGSLAESLSPYWWVNSGAYFSVQNGVGRTIQGALPPNDPWRLAYSASNPEDTDNGFRPQNIFRLVTKAKGKNIIQEGYFRITNDNLSQSPNREGHNGLLFFNRYKDSDNLYYTGIRVDGNAIIKKKINGTYYTLASRKVFPGTYDRASNPNLLPHNVWIGVRSAVKDLPDGSAAINVYMDNGGTGNWTLIAEAVDDGASYGHPIAEEGRAGIRTDFMDVEIKGYIFVKP